MKVLFVTSGNRFNGINPAVKAQADSLTEFDVSIDFFLIIGKGLTGYIKTIFRLRKYLRLNHKYDIIHAHYSFSGFLAALAGAKPLVVSLMGSDIKHLWNICFIIIFRHISWDDIIVKSERMKKALGLKDINIIPNGVDLNLFYPVEKDLAIEKLNWDKSKYHILFGANPSRPEKNYKLLEAAISRINNHNIEIHTLINVSHHMVKYYLNASNIVTLPSLWEGSPNLIKEAMACNCPIVATDVGDIYWIIEGIDGCFISSGKIGDYAEKLELALSFSVKEGKTNGSDRIKKLEIDSLSISKRVMEVYNRTFRVV
jgi:glycosyltransferase involved in cell wall biosynthesis